LGWSPTSLHRDRNALNIPAGIAAIPVDLLFEFATGGFEHASRATWHEAASILYIAAFVFGQWFLIGRWYDRRRGLLPSSSTIPVLRTSRIVHVVAFVGSLLFICFGIWHMLHNGWTSTWITGAGIAAWGGDQLPRLPLFSACAGCSAPSGRMLPTKPARSSCLLQRRNIWCAAVFYKYETSASHLRSRFSAPLGISRARTSSCFPLF